MQLSTAIKKKIKAWEGCRLTAYRCPAGVLTIGYGHTGHDVTPGKKITQAEADALFEQDITRFANVVAGILDGVALKSCQFDALVSFAYNVGTAALRRSTLLLYVKSDPDNPVIRREFMCWDKSGGRVLPGLTKRRMAEADHYFGKI